MGMVLNVSNVQILLTVYNVMKSVLIVVRFAKWAIMSMNKEPAKVVIAIVVLARLRLYVRDVEQDGH